MIDRAPVGVSLEEDLPEIAVKPLTHIRFLFLFELNFDVVDCGHHNFVVYWQAADAGQIGHCMLFVAYFDQKARRLIVEKGWN